MHEIQKRRRVCIDMGYSILTNSLNGLTLRGGLFDAQMLSYLKIMPVKWRDILLPVGEDITVYDPDNTFYSALKEKFDDWSSEDVAKELQSGSDLAKAVNSVVKIKRKSMKHAKKQSARVMREVNKMWKQGHYGEKNKDLRKALDIIHRAFRESFITIRFALKTDAYRCIPQGLEIMMQNGEKKEISSLYVFDQAADKYRIRDDVRLSATDLRYLQLAISPYIFEKIHARLLTR